MGFFFFRDSSGLKRDAAERRRLLLGIARMSESSTVRVFTERAQNERRLPAHLFVGDSQCLLSGETVVIKGRGLGGTDRLGEVCDRGLGEPVCLSDSSTKTHFFLSCQIWFCFWFLTS